MRNCRDISIRTKAPEPFVTFGMAFAGLSVQGFPSYGLEYEIQLSTNTGPPVVVGEKPTSAALADQRLKGIQREF